MSKKKSLKHQKMYKMKGCSTKTRKNHLGGNSSDINLAYPSNNVSTVPNPFLAYTGKGGSNTNAVDKTIPNTGPPSTGFNFLNPTGSQRGGCGCGLPIMNGGTSGGSCPTCSAPLINGGNKTTKAGFVGHRTECKCSSCKIQKGGNNGIPYPNGLVGKSWTPAVDGWPGVDGVQGNRNYLAPNTYNNDSTMQIIATGANPPFSIGGKKRRGRKQRGGTLSNFLGQDLVNLGRQFQFGLGSTYNALAGYSSPINPMPWKEQLPNATNLRASDFI